MTEPRLIDMNVVPDFSGRVSTKDVEIMLQQIHERINVGLTLHGKYEKGKTDWDYTIPPGLKVVK